MLALCRQLTLMQFEDGVGHGGQHPLSLQNVDVPDPEGEGEGSLHRKNTTRGEVLIENQN